VLGIRCPYRAEFQWYQCVVIWALDNNFITLNIFVSEAKWR